jgi:hypothetical protein
MKYLSTIKRSSVVVAILTCVFIATSLSAQSNGTDSPVVRVNYQGETHKGLCCSTWDGKITISEPEQAVPIIVTFSTDYQSNAPFFAALRVNGGPCAFYGPAYLPAFSPDDNTFSSRTFQWVIMPGDYKLVRGRNVIELCGGGLLSTDDTITLGFYTLSADLQK